MWIPKPIDRSDPNETEGIVEKTVARVIEVAPHDRDGDERRNERSEVDGPEEALEAYELSVEEQRCAERDCDGERPADQREVERILEGLPELGRMNQLRVVRE